MNKMIAFGFSTCESLIHKLCSIDDPNNLIQIYQQNKEQFKSEHIVQSLRIIGKHSSEINSDKQFSEITCQLNNIITTLTKQDAVDVLLSLRKCRQNRVPTNITLQTQSHLFSRIQQMCDNQMFSFRNMCSIYHNFSILNHYHENLVKSISEQMLSPTQTSPFIIIQLLNTLVIRINHCNISKHDQIILTKAMQFVEFNLQNFDLEQECQLLQVCAKVQFQNLPPKFQLPKQIYRIESSILIAINSLTEHQLIRILEAYEYLPKYFDFQLLKFLKEKIRASFQGRAQRIHDIFLIDIAEKMINLSHKFNFEIIRSVIIEISGRIQKKIIDFQQIDQLIPALMKYKKIDQFIIAVQQIENKSIMIQKFLFFNGIDTKEFIEDFIKKNKVKSIPLNIATTYAIFCNRDQKENLDQFLGICKEQIQNQPLQALRTFQEIELNYYLKYQLQEEAYLKLIEQVKQQQYDFLKIFKDLIVGCCTKKCKNALSQLYDQLSSQIHPKQLLSRLQAQKVSSLDYESFSALSQILLKDPSKIPIQKFVDYLTLNQKQLQDLIKSDYIQQATKILVVGYQAQPEQKLFPIVNFVIRFEINGYYSEYMRVLLKKTAQIFKTRCPSSPYPDPLFVNLLMNYNLLSPEEAIIQLNNEYIKENTKFLLYGIIQSQKDVPQNILEECNQIKKGLLKEMQTSNQFQPVYNLITLGNLTPEEVQIIKITFEKLLTYIISTNQYFQLIMQTKNASILRELASYFHQFSPKLGIDRTIQAVKKFAKFQIKTQTVYNALVDSYGYFFFGVVNEQRIQILEILALAKIKQYDIFKRTLERIKQFASSYKIYYDDIIEMVINLGFIEKEIVDLINQIIDKNQISSQVALKLMQYQILTNQPIQDIEIHVPSLDEIKNKDNYRTALIYEILLRKYPDSVITKAHEIFLNDDKFQKIRLNLASPTKKSYYIHEFCLQYLQLLGIEVQLNKNIDGINVELYIPSIQTSLFIVSTVQLNFDLISLNGVGILEKVLLETVTKKVIVVNFKQFYNLDTHWDRANYLMHLGIPIKVDFNQVDFSSIVDTDLKDKKGQKTKTNQKNQLEKKDQDEDQ
ncbi:unnamed protein product [Paramecium sonneborni]|uniref:Uncharacterized protein n=1 Tax=Paramecium sonneborni TaxID=65129 RepID=A0A8S1NHI6_9CILI|nr:unnamed protein product [Paramecium sonneborni]